MKYIILLSSILFTTFCFSQQIPQYSQFINNPQLYNPSCIGLVKQSTLSLGGRWQMLGFGSEPRTAFLDGHLKLKGIEKDKINPGLRFNEDSVSNNIDSITSISFEHFVGGQLIVDYYGAFRRTSLNALYSLSFTINNDWKGLIGTSIGFSNFGFNSTKAQVLNTTDPTQSYAGGDSEYDGFVSGSLNKNSIDLGLGLTLMNESFIFGIAANQLSKSSLDLNTNNSVFFDQRIHWNALVGYTYSIDEMLDLQGMIIVKKMMPSPISLEMCVKATFPNSLWAGLHFRNRSSIGLMGGMFINNKFQLGYSIDFSTNKIRNFTNGGHELIISYRFGE
ncbi:MAG: hypothetical protein RLZ10_2460 [Bacteroidota bacterium]|jgi:type IX secretion system PorP/SprF family membrane protein